MSGTEEAVADEGYAGGADSDGIISRAVQYLFHAAHTRTDAKCAVFVLLLLLVACAAHVARSPGNQHHPRPAPLAESNNKQTTTKT